MVQQGYGQTTDRRQTDGSYHKPNVSNVRLKSIADLCFLLGSCVDELARQGHRWRSRSFIGGFKLTVISYSVVGSDTTSPTALFSTANYFRICIRWTEMFWNFVLRVTIYQIAIFWL